MHQRQNQKRSSQILNEFCEQTMASNLVLENQLCFRIYTLNKLMGRLYSPVLKELSLTYPQYLVMMVLWQNDEPVSVKDIGQQLDLDSGTLSPLLKRLATQSLLTRVRQQDDERVVLISLTKKGKKLQESAEHIPKEMFSETGLSLDNLQSLTVSLDQLIHQLSA